MSVLIQGHRIFLRSHQRPVPGYVVDSEPGTVMLPLKLDGSMRAVQTGYASSDPEVLEAYLEQTIHTHNLPSFVNRKNWFVLYKDRKTFEAVHRPPWIEAVARSIVDTVEDYAAGEGSIISKLTPYNLIEELQTICNRLASYTSSLLYMGMFDEDRVGLAKTSHELFCRPLENVTPARIRMMGWLFIIDHAFHKRLKTQYGVEDHEGNRRSFMDPNIFDSFEVNLLGKGGVEYRRTLHSHERSTEVFFTGPDGNITPRSEYKPNATFEMARLNAISKAAHTTNTYIFAELNMSAADIFRLSNAEEDPVRETHDFLIHEKGVLPDLAHAMTQSVLNVINDVTSNPRLVDHGTA